VCDWRKRGVNHEEAHILYAVRLGKVFDLLIKHFIFIEATKGLVAAMKYDEAGNLKDVNKHTKGR